MVRSPNLSRRPNSSQDVHACKQHLDRFFRSYPDPVMQESAVKSLRFLAAGDQPLPGKPEGWAAGILYYCLANRYRRPCGVAGILNAEFERFYDVSMDTVRNRAAKVVRAITV